MSQKILQYGYSSIKLNDGNFIKHEKIKLIKVIVKNNIVTVQAIQNECIVYDKEYVYNQDFKLDNGVIVKKREFALLSRGLGDVLVGPSYEETIIGLGIEEDGVYKNDFVSAGLVFLLFPVVFAIKENIRFKKLKTDKNYSKCIR
ncbi:hypothetical protein [uncultured Gammaproteobacteria bacterium]|nr:hypothetical protein [uncultured Gammaproteobacteria bacterium]CAC9989663.1 hypothetical protein [uncultured Gammaproteobacteria bacterium]